MPVLLLTLGLASVGFGLTILFGAPQEAIAEFEFWPQSGVLLITLGALLICAATLLWARRRRTPEPLDAAAKATLDELDVRIAKLLSDVQIREQWRAVAADYGDDTRAHALEAELLDLRNQLATANARANSVTGRPRVGRRLTIIRDQDTLTVMNDTGSRVVIGEIRARGSVDVTTYQHAPFDLPAAGTFRIDLDRVSGRDEQKSSVSVRWADTDGRERLQDIAV